jgi:hypothetical protein
MNSKFRRLLTLLVLLTFSLETVAAVAISSAAGKFTTHHKIEVQKERPGATSFLSELNEGNDDDKVRGLATSPQVFVPYFNHSFVSKIKPTFQRSLDSRQHKQIILVICSLII